MGKKLIDLQKYPVKEGYDYYHPPILDKDPGKAAVSMTKVDMHYSFTAMRVVLEELCDKKLKEFKYPILHDVMSHNRRTFLWFACFFEELDTIINNKCTYPVPYEKILKNIPSGDSAFRPQKPFTIINNSCEYKHLTSSTKDVVALHRISYILEQHEVTEFKNGYPAWYLGCNMTVFENYDPSTNTRVRIDFRDREFAYFVSGASDNWQIIDEVPLEIDAIVYALLTRDW